MREVWANELLSMFGLIEGLLDDWRRTDPLASFIADLKCSMDPGVDVGTPDGVTCLSGELAEQDELTALIGLTGERFGIFGGQKGDLQLPDVRLELVAHYQRGGSELPVRSPSLNHPLAHGRKQEAEDYAAERRRYRHPGGERGGGARGGGSGRGGQEHSPDGMPSRKSWSGWSGWATLAVMQAAMIEYMRFSGLVAQSVQEALPHLPRWERQLRARGIHSVPQRPGQGPAYAENWLNLLIRQAAKVRDHDMEHELRELTRPRPPKPRRVRPGRRRTG
jgi:hypothetical protein